MTTLRLLLWLRWKTFLRSSSMGNRIAGVVLVLVTLLAFSPLWIAGAVGGWAGVSRHGTLALTVVFGACQIGWIWLELVWGALGRTFDLDVLLRHPVRPRTVFALNIVTSLFAPAPLMVLPALAGAVLGAAQRSGPAAAAGVALGAASLLLVTAGVLQVLLALLDELLRREWARWIASAILALTFVSLQLTARRWALAALERWLHHTVTGAEALRLAASFLGKLPTVAGPAWIAGGALEGSALRVALGLVASAALLALCVLPGGWLMRRTVRAGEGGPRRVRVRESGGGSFAGAASALPRGLGLLLARELRYTVRHPQRVLSVVLAPLVAVLFVAGRPGRMGVNLGLVAIMMSSTIASSSLLQFGYDGPGIRSLVLLPCAPRDVVLSKNLELLLRIGLQAALIAVTLELFTGAPWSALQATVLLASIAVVACVLAIGTAASIAQPVRARRRGLGMRMSGGLPGLLVQFGMMGVAGVVAGLVFVARRLAGTAADPVGLAVAVLALAAGAAIWWHSLDLNAARFAAGREKLIATLARIDDD